MRLTDRIHLVGSGRFGLSLSDDYDCNIYLIDGGPELALVDSGAGRHPGALRDHVVAAGFDPAAVSTILLTHKHADHSGGAGEFQREFGARVLGSVATVAAVSDAASMNDGLAGARERGAYPSDYRFTGVAEARVLAAGEVVTVGNVSIVVVDAGGHCDGHLAYVVGEGDGAALFTGDALLPGGEIVVQPSVDFSMALSLQTIHRFADLAFGLLMPGHGAPVLRDGHRHARLALLEAKRNGVPAAFRTPPFQLVARSGDPQ